MDTVAPDLPQASTCSCSHEGLAQFFADHPSLLRAFTNISRSKVADHIVGGIANFGTRRLRQEAHAYEATAKAYACSTRSGAVEDLDGEFFAGIPGGPNDSRKLAQLLHSLEKLNRSTRVGLLKTWIHTSVLTGIIRRAHILRNEQSGGSEVYPMDAIIAPFGRCDLRCRGCFNLHDLEGETTKVEILDDLITQLKALNIYHVLLVGKGEPFLDEASRKALFTVVRRHPQVFFSVYSNGTNISDKDIDNLKQLPNLITMLSIDGSQSINDWRRGEGVYDKVVDAMRRMERAGLFFGYISTVFKQNWEALLDPAFITHMANLGCKVAMHSLFISYPRGQNKDMMLDPATRSIYFEQFNRVNGSAPIPLFDIDGIEAQTGCRAKQGSSLYIDAINGEVSPCIREPLLASTPSLNQGHSLASILGSEAFRAYRADVPEWSICQAFHSGEATGSTCSSVCSSGCGSGTSALREPADAKNGG